MPEQGPQQELSLLLTAAQLHVMAMRTIDNYSQRTAIGGLIRIRNLPQSGRLRRV